MEAHRRAWVLNLDADRELAQLGARPGLYVSPPRLRAQMKAFMKPLAASLLGPDDVLLEQDSPTAMRSARGLSGVSFCPTPSALALLRRAGSAPEAHPAADVLRRVNSRAFAASLAATEPLLPGARFVTTFEAACEALAEAPPSFARDGTWRVKRSFGMAGRGQRLFRADRTTATKQELALDAAELGFLRAGIAEGGVQIEPNVVIAQEFALHGMVSAENDVLALGALVEQQCDASGAWVSSRLVNLTSDPANEVIDKRLRRQARHVANALIREGYFGPFGVDAFTYRGTDAIGPQAYLPVMSEVNARYSMGFGVGFFGRA